MNAQTLIDYVEGLTHVDRVRRMVRLGHRAAAGDAEVGDVLRELRAGDTYARTLALYAVFGSRDGEHAIAGLQDASRSVRSRAAALVALVCDRICRRGAPRKPSRHAWSKQQRRERLRRLEASAAECLWSTILGIGSGFGDTLEFSPSVVPFTHYLTNNGAGHTLQADMRGGGGDDWIEGSHSASGAYSETLAGGSGSDTIRAFEGDDVCYGDSGEDLMDGGDGNDWMDGGPDDDVMYGGEGDDDMRGYLGNDEMHGEEGADTVNGDGGTDLVCGGDDGDDVVDGGPDNGDRVDGGGGSGVDTVRGGPGSGDECQDSLGSGCESHPISGAYTCL